MGIAERRKGQRGEREVAEIFRAHGYDVNRARDPGARQLHGDLFGAGFGRYVDVKNHATIRMRPWLGKLVADARDQSRPPMLVFKHDGEWWMAERLSDRLGANGAADH
jgi:Holliday junction resolvase